MTFFLFSEHRVPESRVTLRLLTACKRLGSWESGQLVRAKQCDCVSHMINLFPFHFTFHFNFFIFKSIFKFGMELCVDPARATSAEIIFTAVY